MCKVIKIGVEWVAAAALKPAAPASWFKLGARLIGHVRVWGTRGRFNPPSAINFILMIIICIPIILLNRFWSIFCAPNPQKRKLVFVWKKFEFLTAKHWLSWLPHTAWIWIWMTKRPGVASDGNFSSYLISRSWYNHFRSFSMGGNGNNTIYPLLST